jgi:hypothetical protein
MGATTTRRQAMSGTISETIWCERSDTCDCELHQALRERDREYANGEAWRGEAENTRRELDEVRRDRDRTVDDRDRLTERMDEILRKLDEARADAKDCDRNHQVALEGWRKCREERDEARQERARAEHLWKIAIRERDAALRLEQDNLNGMQTSEQQRDEALADVEIWRRRAHDLSRERDAARAVARRLSILRRSTCDDPECCSDCIDWQAIAAVHPWLDAAGGP